MPEPQAEKRGCVWIDGELHAELAHRAIDERRSIQAVAEDAVREYIAKHKEK